MTTEVTEGLGRAFACSVGFIALCAVWLVIAIGSAPSGDEDLALGGHGAGSSHATLTR